jgi:D-glycero-D-manno-heptose 1,7-bisphosphate phosphatase
LLKQENQILDLVMLDRDGVINQDLPSSVRSLKELKLLPGAGEAISLLNQRAIPVVVITNQAVVGRGEISLEELHKIHEEMRRLLALEHAYLDDIYFCTDVTVAPNFRRKPAPGMLKEALDKFNARPSYSPMVGDALRDLQAAAEVGCPRILVRTGKGLDTEKEGWPEDLNPVRVFPNLLKAIQSLLESLDTLKEPFDTFNQRPRR